MDSLLLGYRRYRGTWPVLPLIQWILLLWIRVSRDQNGMEPMTEADAAGVGDGSWRSPPAKGLLDKLPLAR
ncbi:TPA: hypothetical protein ACGD2I_003902, partial [Aeromonas hydrophila]|uniref:hypothetical protein n=1 Tax=Aeromonas hydrophila TaxID=644 RepID=UPI001CDA275A